MSRPGANHGLDQKLLIAQSHAIAATPSRSFFSPLRLVSLSFHHRRDNHAPKAENRQNAKNVKRRLKFAENEQLDTKTTTGLGNDKTANHCICT